MALKLALFLLACFLLASTRVSSDSEEAFTEAAMAPYVPATPPALAPAPHKIIDTKECVGACKERCSLHSRKNVCSRACLTCCSVCKCVPAGTAGNKETCGKCYTDWQTHGNRTKCP
ncbi:snakin-2-like [Ananas comosus]|uniref:Gibberellin-regulated protein 14 n=1 Tax=Ananas comosus TaxID=4615 RepID=A0A199VH03_ANACO|nr:snakin-2-like [Ananas comosus]XP_020108543.1 snakin-2-like [Ananas comosus]OAY76156.1 Gibberellin-regulated protein 14 [Ananas comosus]